MCSSDLAFPNPLGFGPDISPDISFKGVKNIKSMPGHEDGYLLTIKPSDSDKPVRPPQTAQSEELPNK